LDGIFEDSHVISAFVEPRRDVPDKIEFPLIVTIGGAIYLKDRTTLYSKMAYTLDSFGRRLAFSGTLKYMSVMHYVIAN